MAEPNTRRNVEPGLGLEPGSIWEFPNGAQISIQAHTDIAMRSVAKKQSGGTVKERWAQGDWAIQIDGMLINQQLNELGEETPPAADLSKLTQLCNAPQAIYVQGDEFTHFGIDRIVITDLALPYTPNRANNRFTITAVSDQPVELV